MLVKRGRRHARPSMHSAAAEGASAENGWRSAQPLAAFYATSLASERANPLPRPLTDGVACAVSYRYCPPSFVGRLGSTRCRTTGNVRTPARRHRTGPTIRFLAALTTLGHRGLSTESGIILHRFVFCVRPDIAGEASERASRRANKRANESAP